MADKTYPGLNLGDDNLMTVGLAGFMPGGAGCNIARWFVNNNDPAALPDVNLVVDDADGQLLRARFVPKPEQSVFDRNDGRADPDANLRKWYEAGQLTVNQAHNGGKLFGAGGVPAIGKVMAATVRDKIKASCTGKDLIIRCGAGGGGFGGPLLQLVGEVAKELQIPIITILITPFAKEFQGGKLAIANTLRRELGSDGGLIVIRNEDVPKNERNVPPEELYNKINDRIYVVFRMLIQVTQFAGTTSNVDLRDLLTVASMGKDGCFSYYDAPSDETIDVAQVVQHLSKPPLQAAGMIAKSAVFLFEGGWSLSEMEDIQKGHLKNFGFEDGLVKYQDNYHSTMKSVSVLCFGSHADSDALENVELVELTGEKQKEKRSSQEEEAEVARRTKEEKHREIKQRYAKEESRVYPSIITEGGVPTPCSVPPSVARDWRKAKGEGDKERLRELISVFEAFGFNPDLPKTKKSEVVLESEQAEGQAELPVEFVSEQAESPFVPAASTTDEVPAHEGTNGYVALRSDFKACEPDASSIARRLGELAVPGIAPDKPTNGRRTVRERVADAAKVINDAWESHLDKSVSKGR